MVRISGGVVARVGTYVLELLAGRVNGQVDQISHQPRVHRLISAFCALPFVHFSPMNFLGMTARIHPPTYPCQPGIQYQNTPRNIAFSSPPATVMSP